MRIGAGSLSGISNPYSGLAQRIAATTHAAPKLLIEGLANGISVAESLSVDRALDSVSEGVQDRNSVLERIQRLIEEVTDKTLARLEVSNNGSTNARSAPEQQAIDEALAEIGRLIGVPLRLGGAKRAVVSGVNDEQIEAYEVLYLRPNAELTLSGSLLGARRPANGHVPDTLGGLRLTSISTDISGLNEAQIDLLNTGSLQPGAELTVSGSLDVAQAAAELVYAGAPGGLVSGTASFRLTGSDSSANFSITAGEALSAVAQRINEQTEATGVVAAVQGNSLTLSTIATGAAVTLVVDNVDRESVVSVSDINGNQVDDFQVVSVPDEAEITINGSVTAAATRATLTYLGGPGGVVVDSATFTLTGDLGSAPISIVQGESLTAVAGRINQLSQTTGVSATTSGNNLILSSVILGAAADLAVELTEIAQYVNVAGVNASQITNFQVLSADPASVNTLAGSVTQAAGVAQLTYTGGFGGRITATANFTLTGSLGSANISVTFLETLTAVRDRINLQTATTGVTASVSGNQLFLRSTGVGTAATVAVVVNSGTFNVTGGNGNGTANGTNAQLQINGQPVVAAGNNVSFTDALGSYAFTLVNGFTGAFNPITITSSNGTFDITGGHGDGTATGTDAAATINGQPLTATVNTFVVNTGGGQFVLEIAEGFTGALDPIVVTSSLADFTITGGNGDGTANGTDAEATINGQNLTSANGRFTVLTPGGNLVVGFHDSFVGAFDTFTIAIRQRSIGSDNTEPAPIRRAAVATINGRRVGQ